jgi:hypothetical protein
MGLEIYVQRYENGEAVAFSRSVLSDILGSHAIVRDGKILGMKFADDDWGDIDGAEEEEIRNLCFDGGGTKFMQAIWEIANRTNSHIFWIDEPPNLAITRQDALAYVPEEVVQDFGPVEVVRDGEELTGYISRRR